LFDDFKHTVNSGNHGLLYNKSYRAQKVMDKALKLRAKRRLSKRKSDVERYRSADLSERYILFLRKVSGQLPGKVHNAIPGCNYVYCPYKTEFRGASSLYGMIVFFVDGFSQFVVPGLEYPMLTIDWGKNLLPGRSVILMSDYDRQVYIALSVRGNKAIYLVKGCDHSTSGCGGVLLKEWYTNYKHKVCLYETEYVMGDDYVDLDIGIYKRRMPIMHMVGGL
jgi:hypothetical protein